MIKKSDIDTQLEFLQKDRLQVQTRLDQATDEIKQLDRTLASIDGAIQVSNHYLSMIDKNDDVVDNGTSKGSKSEKKDKK